MRKFGKPELLIAFALTLIMAGSCSGGGNTPAKAESPTPLVASPPPVIGTDTPVPSPTQPPSATVPTSVSSPQVLVSAIAKTKGAKVVRFELDSTATFTQDGKQVTQPGTSVKGEGTGTDQALTISTPNLATGIVETYELIKVGNQTYVKGLSLSPQLDANTWYRLESAGGAQQGSSPSPRGILLGITETNFLSLDFNPAESGVVDDQSCEVWSSQNLALTKEFGTLSNNPDVLRQLANVDSFQVKLWTCADGFMHQVQGLITGHDPASPGEKASLEFSYHYYDFGANINITAPPNPQPVPVVGPALTSTP